MIVFGKMLIQVWPVAVINLEWVFGIE